MATLILTVGCSGSGKTTYTENFLKYHDAVNLNRDNVRFNLVQPNATNWSEYRYNDFNESVVTQHIMNKFYQAVEENKDVILSDTNLNKLIRESWIDLGFQLGYKVKVLIFNRTLTELLDINEFRVKPLDYLAIRSQYRRFTSFLNTPLIDGVEYVVIGESL